MEVIEDGTVKETKPVYANILLPIIVSPFIKVTSLRELKARNAKSPILIIVDGITKVDKVVDPPFCANTAYERIVSPLIRLIWKIEGYDAKA